LEPGISQAPLVRLEPTGSGVTAWVTTQLLQRGHEVVGDNWHLEGITDPEEIKRIREMNHAYRATGDSPTSVIQMWRWAPSAGTSLLLVEAVWIDAGRKFPLFAADAVVQELPAPKVLSFNYTKAEWMRMAEFRDRDWTPDADNSAFRNAWKIGADLFVLTYLGGYEGYSVELQKVDSIKGLVPILGFGQ
jgi:hypothetical protein